MIYNVLLITTVVLCSAEKVNSRSDTTLEEASTLLKKVNKDTAKAYSCLEDSVSCPPWSHCDIVDQTCKCIMLPGAPLMCDKSISTKHIKPPYILDCYCITYNVDDKLMEIGECDFNCGRYGSNKMFDMVYRALPPNMSDWNNFMCVELNRSGTLCGKCDEKNDYYPRTYSFDISCINCKNKKTNWWKYILLAYLPLTIFYLIIFFLKVDINSSQLHGFIVFSQFISVPALARNLILITRNKPGILAMTKFVGSLYGIWNLDFFRPYNNDICLRLSSLSNLSLDLAVAVYPLFLMIFTYVLIRLYQNYKPLMFLWWPFKVFLGKCYGSISVKTSLVDAFATFLFLSNMKFFSISFDILTPVRVFQFYTPYHVNVTWRLYYDPTIVYFSTEHCIYATLALTSLSLLVIFPILILLLYSSSFFQKCLTILPHRWQITLHTFVDSFQGSYKNGTEPGSRDCRWYAPVFYICRLLLMIFYAISLDATYFPYGAMFLTLIASMTIIVEPFKAHLKHLSSAMAVYILFIAAFYVCAAGTGITERNNDALSTYIFYAFTVVIGLLPILHVSIHVIVWIIQHCKLCVSVVNRIKLWNLSYNE